MRKPSNLRTKLPLFALCGAILLVWVLLEIPCPFRHATGLICPGCGMGRAWLAALRLDLTGAIRYHPLFWTVPVAAVFILYDCRIFRKERLNTIVLGSIALAVAVCYGIRLFLFLQGKLPIL